MSRQYLTIHTIDSAHTADIFSLAITPTVLFSASGSPALHIHSIIEPDYPLIQTIPDAHPCGAHHVCTARGGLGRIAVSVGFGGEIKIWVVNSSADWKLQHQITPAAMASATGGCSVSGAWAVALSADERYLACTTQEGKIHVWNVETRDIVQIYETGTSSKASFAMSLDLSRDGRLTASGHQDGGVYVFNNDTGRLAYALSGLARPIRAVAFSPGCSRLAAAGDAGIIALYEMKHGEHVGNLTPSSTSNAWITTLDWNGSGEYILSGSLDGKLRVWNASQKTCIATHTHSEEALWCARWLLKLGKDATGGKSNGSKAEIFCAAGADRAIGFYREAAGV